MTNRPSIPPKVFDESSHTTTRFKNFKKSDCNDIRYMYNWSPIDLGDHEPKIYFNDELRMKFMQWFVINRISDEMEMDTREKWKIFSVEFQKKIDEIIIL